MKKEKTGDNSRPYKLGKKNIRIFGRLIRLCICRPFLNKFLLMIIN